VALGGESCNSSGEVIVEFKFICERTVEGRRDCSSAYGKVIH
jgi:hypothetical protein